MDYRSIERAAKDQGWRIKPSKKGLMFYPPDETQSPVAWHGTPSDVRAMWNFLARLRIRGLEWPWPPEGKLG